MLDFNDVVSNVQVYGLRESVKASKYAKATDVNAVNDTITKTVKALAQSPCGAGHDNFLLGIIVQFNLTFSIKAWTEAERYHFFDIVTSESTMHKICDFELVPDRFNEHVDGRLVEILKEKIGEYKADPSPEKYLDVLYNVPVGFKLTAQMSTNYRQLKTIYKQRKNHRLPEWRAFCAWVETLPFAKALIVGEEDAEC